MIAFLDQWQTLIGAALGGVVALFIATVVTGMERWRELRRAAAQIAIQLQRFESQMGAMVEGIKVDAQPSSGSFVTTMDLIRLRPRLDTLFLTTGAQLYTLDTGLTGRLEGLLMLADVFEKQAAHLEEAHQRFLRSEVGSESAPRLQSLVRDVVDAGRDAMFMASNVTPILATYGLSKMPSRLVRKRQRAFLLGKDRIPDSSQWPSSHSGEKSR